MELVIVNKVFFVKIDEYTYKEYFTFNGVSERIVCRVYNEFNAFRVTDQNEMVFESKSSKMPMHILKNFDYLLKNVSISAAADFDEYGEHTGIMSLIVVGTPLV